MKCTETLMQEHAIIKTYLRNLMREVQSSKTLNRDGLDDYFNFFRSYADKYHHAKEENILFHWMTEKNQMLQHGPIAVMLQEHEICRNALRTAEQALNDGNQTKARASFSEFCETLYDHILKEDNVLYRMADSLDNSTHDGDDKMWPQFLQVRSELAEIERKWGETPLDPEVIRETNEMAKKKKNTQVAVVHAVECVTRDLFIPIRDNNT